MRIVELLTGERLRGRDVEARFNRLNGELAAKLGRPKFRDHPFDGCCGRKLAGLVDYLAAVGPEREVAGRLHLLELHLFGKGPQDTYRMVKVWIDWPDYAPWIEGEPNLHFRLEVHGDGRRLGESRPETPADVERAIGEAFGW